jgi:hypothetical protein
MRVGNLAPVSEWGFWPLFLAVLFVARGVQIVLGIKDEHVSIWPEGNCPFK